jgi:hypothetical protein
LRVLIVVGEVVGWVRLPITQHDVGLCCFGWAT